MSDVPTQPLYSLPSFNPFEPVDKRILDTPILSNQIEGISKVADLVYIITKNCNGRFTQENFEKEFNTYAFRSYYFIDPLRRKNFTVDSAREHFTYYWNIAVRYQSDQLENEKLFVPKVSEMVEQKKTEKAESTSSSGFVDSLRTLFPRVLNAPCVAFLAGVVLHKSKEKSLLVCTGLGFIVGYGISNFFKNSDRETIEDTRLTEKEPNSAEDVVNSYIRLISCSICYKNAEPSTCKTEMKQFGCHHAICTDCSLELMRHHWNDCSENRPPFRCPMCCKQGQLEPLCIHYV